MRVPRVVLCLLVAIAGALRGAGELDLPWGPVKRLASPDGSKVLYGVSFQEGRNNGPQLWIEDTRTHKRTKLLDLAGTVSAGWAPDGTAFYVNDHEASNEEEAYIYDAATLQRVNISEKIQAADPESRRLATGHRYFHVRRWEDTKELGVIFTGHTDEAPVLCFGLRYRVSRAGAVMILSQRITPATANACDESP